MSSSAGEKIEAMVSDPSFPLTAAVEAMQAPPLFTASTVLIAQLRRRHPSETTDETAISRDIYPKHYGRIGVLRALAEQGVVSIPAGDRYVLNEIFERGGKKSQIGANILDFFDTLRDIHEKKP